MTNVLDPNSGIITEIERYSIHDGPGVRSVVFLKGCQLRCKWCCNPETFVPEIEMGYFKDLCINCGRCIKDCPYEAIKFDSELVLFTDRNICRKYCIGILDKFPCTEHCYTSARKEIGVRKTVNEIVKEVERDRKYYQQTGGGVTITGGEISFQSNFALTLINLLHNKWIDVGIETNGMGLPDFYERIFKFISFAFLDIKILKENDHLKWTNSSNRKILNTAILFSDLSKKYNVRIIVRVPIIPTVNDKGEIIESILEFLYKNAPNLREIEFLPYHKLGRSKYKSIGLEYELDGINPMDEEIMDDFETLSKEKGFIPVRF